MADGRGHQRTAFDLAALPDGPFGTIIQSLGVRDKIRLQLVNKALRRALQQPQVLGSANPPPSFRHRSATFGHSDLGRKLVRHAVSCRTLCRFPSSGATCHWS